MSILQEARQLLVETDQKIRDPTSTATETAWAAINFADKMSVMLPELLAYAEMRERQAIEERARYLMTSNNDRAIYENIGQIKSNEDFMEQAARELSADLPSRITEEEKEAIEAGIHELVARENLALAFRAKDDAQKMRKAIDVLRGMIS